MFEKLSGYKREITRKLYFNKFIRFLYLPFLKIPAGKTYIFVLGCYDSGTTLLNEILGHHPEISMLDTEGIYLTPHLKGPESFGWNRMYHKCLPQMEIEENKAAKIFEEIKKDWGLRHDKSKPFFIEKSVANALWIQWLDKYFDNSYFIFIVRNGYAASEGIRRRTKGKIRHFEPQKEYPIQLCAQQWNFSNDLIEEKLKNTENNYFLKYEDLAENPAKVSREILEWLPVKKKQVKLIDEFEFHGQKTGIKNMNPGSIKRLSGEDIESINSVASKHLQKYGYELLEGGNK
ncbi:MAG: sulfotransferase [bacterium]|nr:sulfotransferase [bacterium]